MSHLTREMVVPRRVHNSYLHPLTLMSLTTPPLTVSLVNQALRILVLVHFYPISVHFA